jgi:hypothetical protein
VVVYVRCTVCGRYMERSGTGERRYCSAGCAQLYSRCTNCGRFFATGQGVDAQTCSQSCATRYQIQRPAGALPAGAFGQERP